jgi:4-hydroxybenzoate polyprenyltransferase
MEAARAAIEAFRPLQWVKNGLVFAAPMFAFSISFETFPPLLATFVLFCAVSSGVYLINDLCDVEADQLHPIKKDRPIPSGRLGVSTARVLALFLVVGSLACAWILAPTVCAVLSAYVVIQLLYNFKLKHVLFLDLMALASGFVLRAVAGGVAGQVRLSSWFLFCVGLVSFYVALEKRKGELKRVNETGVTTRRVLEHYSIPYIQQIETATLACLLIGYALWTIQAAGTDWMMITLPFVLYGLLRYQYLSQEEIVERPEEALFRDRPLLINLLAWGIACILVLAAERSDLL